MRQARTRLTVAAANAARYISTVLALTALFILSGCVHPEQPAHESAPAPPPPPATEIQPEQMPKLPPPSLEEAKETVNRIFKDAATLDTGAGTSFIVGDFNGDLSQDIAVIVRPVPGKLEEMNVEYPAWMLKDVFEPDRPGMKPLQVEPNETLLAVIHGHGPKGWRDPEATQTYLLKNGAGSGMKANARKEFAAANRGKTLPQFYGDLIGEVLQDKSGYLYYTGPTYAWYDPKTFAGEPAKRLGHGRAVRMGQ